ncbi:hypothetical protein L226DRAFT_610748 [Lentinus tigrinus ALCF2SS1-7]|uniref:uncharacterized protein n=1 Tax=Lentinus tigrinus ALCF2SS1-7 TaxID=1328758 RepID=UPI001166132D|nr:hypothetical protein L226DRAFT_610748 [Lentinus tigrinus ALCF2SS1-7]
MATYFLTLQPAATAEAMEVDGFSMLKAGARKLYQESIGHGESAGLYNRFNPDVAMPSGKRGKYEEDVEMSTADNVKANAPAKPKLAGLRRQFRSLRALTRFRPFKRAAKVAERMDIDCDSRAATTPFTFTFVLRPSVPELSVRQHQPDRDVPMDAMDDADDLARAFSLVSFVQVEPSMASPADARKLWQPREPTLPLEDEAEDEEAAKMAIDIREDDDQDTPVLTGNSVVSVVALLEQCSFEAPPEEPDVHSEQVDTASAEPADASTHNSQDVAQEVLTERQAETPTQPFIDTADPLLASSDTTDHLIELSCSISVLTDLSVDEDTDDAEEPTASVPPGRLCDDFFGEVREPSPAIPDDDEEEKPIRFPFAIFDNSKVGFAPATDSVDDLVAIFADLRVSRSITSSEPQSIAPTPTPPAPLQLVVDLPVSTKTTSAELPSTYSSPTPAPLQPIADPVTTVDKEEEVSEAWFDASDVSEDEDDDEEEEVWFDCVETFEPFVEEPACHVPIQCLATSEPVEEELACVPARAQAQAQDCKTESCQQESTVLPGGLYDHNEELDFDPSGDLQALCTYLVGCVTRFSTFLISRLAA